MLSKRSLRVPRLQIAWLVRSGLLLLTLLFTAACHLEMYDQAKNPPLTRSDFFQNESSARPLVPNTVARGELRIDDVSTGKVNGDGEFVKVIPVPVTPELIARGEGRYAIFCAACHGPKGEGKGTAVNALLKPRPPSFYDQRIVSLQDGYYFEVITNGKGTMYPYGYRVNIQDRWAIIAYIRELQKNPPPAEGTAPEQSK